VSSPPDPQPTAITAAAPSAIAARACLVMG